MAAHGLARSAGADQARTPRCLDLWLLRRLGAEINDVGRTGTQRRWPLLRDLRQSLPHHRRSRRARPERSSMVPTQPAAADGEVVLAQQRQLPAERPAAGALRLRRPQAALSRTVLSAR